MPPFVIARIQLICVLLRDFVHTRRMRNCRLSCLCLVCSLRMRMRYATHT